MTCIVMQIPKDWVLFAIIILVVTVDLLIILIGTAMPSSRLNATSVPDVQHQNAVRVSTIVCMRIIIDGITVYTYYTMQCMHT